MPEKRVTIEGITYSIFANKVSKRSKNWVGHWLDRYGVSHGPARVFDSESDALMWAEIDLNDAIMRSKNSEFSDNK